jgi:hypothetical protein
MLHKKVKTIIFLLMAVALIVMAGSYWGRAGMAADQKPKTTGRISWNFDNIPLGQLPAGWKADATRRRGPLATWQVIRDTSAFSGGRVLALTRINHNSGGTFNLCWTKSISFLNGEIEVRLKAVRGGEDQGGGVMWRVQDSKNYYVARFNPLEDNFRLYTVHNGARRMLADARIKLPAGKWITMKIIQKGTRFEAFLDGRKLLTGENDLFTKAGGVGLWTKADAVTSFDDFSVKLLKP